MDNQENVGKVTMSEIAEKMMLMDKLDYMVKHKDFVIGYLLKKIDNYHEKLNSLELISNDQELIRSEIKRISNLIFEIINEQEYPNLAKLIFPGITMFNQEWISNKLKGKYDYTNSLLTEFKISKIYNSKEVTNFNLEVLTDTLIDQAQRKIKKFQNLPNPHLNAYAMNGINGYSEYITYLNGLKEKQLPKIKIGLKSFKSILTTLQLESLWQSLKDNDFIAPRTSIEAFTAIFAEELTGCQTIKWTGSNRLLSYLFNQLYAANFILKEWQSIIENNRLFINKTGKPITAGDLATALSEINDLQNGLNPKGSDKIDSILKNLKTLRP